MSMYALTEEMLIEKLADCALKDKQDSHTAHHDRLQMHRPMCVHN